MFCSGENLVLNIYIHIHIHTHIHTHIDLCVRWQEPFPVAPLSKGLVLHNLFANTLIYVQKSEVASLSSQNSAGFKGKA